MSELLVVKQIVFTTIAEGSKYNFDINGTKMEIKWDSTDANVAAKFADSNACSGWTAQI